MRAVTAFVAGTLDGEQIVHAGEILDGGDEIVQANPSLFEAADEVTQTPGRKVVQTLG